ncbi:MAG: TraR/DksA family transcriptional regulator [Phycisphaerales bacterium]|nr:TraR/DksA family transcriptional regulator [Phycisphaerales bacterium]
MPAKKKTASDTKKKNKPAKAAVALQKRNPAKLLPVAPMKKQAPPTAPQLTKLPPPKVIYQMPKSIVGEPPPPPKRSKGAPPPVIAKPKMKMKPSRLTGRPKETKKRIDFANAESVATAAMKAATAQKSTTGYVMINGRRVRVLSLKGIKIPKKKGVSKAEKLAAAEAEAESKTLRFGKTKLSERDLEKYHEILLKLRTQIVGRVELTEKEALKGNDGNLSTMPLHMADIGTDTFEQDFALEFAHLDRQLVHEVDDALGRIKDRTYGICLMSAKPIPKGRLDSKPWARYTIESERIAERTRGRV